jgi:hypothetical protein
VAVNFLLAFGVVALPSTVARADWPTTPESDR